MATQRFAVLLRGVNVGKGPRVAMATLRELLAALGHHDVRTLLNSGNAVFATPSRGDATALAGQVQAALAERCGVDVAVIVKSAAEVGDIVAGNPIATDQPSRLLVAFAQRSDALAGLSVLQPLLADGERLEVGTQAAYLLCPRGLHDSKAATALLGRAGRALTTRNWATTLKLAAMFEP